VPRRRQLTAPARSPVTATLTAGALVALAAAGCSPGAVAVAPPPADPRADVACAALHTALPQQVLGGTRRETDPPGSRTAAWGKDPLVTLVCGVPAPAPPRAASSADLVEIDGLVNWLPVPTDAGGYDLYAYGRTVWVRVSVPRTDRNPVDAATDLTPAVARTVPAG